MRAVRTKEDKGQVWIKFSVEDTGIGMTPLEQENLFKDFQQANETIARNYGGTGLGLSISKSLVDLMSGEISVKSAKDYGSTFSFTIPLEKVETDDSELNPAELINTRVLIIDDNQQKPCNVRAIVSHTANEYCDSFHIKRSADLHKRCPSREAAI